MINIRAIFRYFFSTALVLALLLSQNICAAESLVHDCIPHSHDSESESHNHDSGHHSHDSHGASHDHKNNNQDDSCCKNQTPALISSAISSSQIKAFFPVYIFTIQSFSSFNLEAPTEYVWIANGSPPGITFQSQLLSSLSISPNAPPAFSIS